MDYILGADNFKIGPNRSAIGKVTTTAPMGNIYKVKVRIVYHCQTIHDIIALNARLFGYEYMFFVFCFFVHPNYYKERKKNLTREGFEPLTPALSFKCPY